MTSRQNVTANIWLFFILVRRFITWSNRLYDEETEELSEEYENLSGDIADLTKTEKTPGGISLFTDSSKTEYKSTYEILKEISEIYDDLTDKDQADLLSKLFGKTRAGTPCPVAQKCA